MAACRERLCKVVAWLTLMAPACSACARGRRLVTTNGIDVLLQCVAAYKGKDPATAEEEEFMQVRCAR